MADKEEGMVYKTKYDLRRLMVYARKDLKNILGINLGDFVVFVNEGGRIVLKGLPVEEDLISHARVSAPGYECDLKFKCGVEKSDIVEYVSAGGEVQISVIKGPARPIGHSVARWREFPLGQKVEEELGVKPGDFVEIKKSENGNYLTIRKVSAGGLVVHGGRENISFLVFPKREWHKLGIRKGDRISFYKAGGGIIAFGTWAGLGYRIAADKKWPRISSGGPQLKPLGLKDGDYVYLVRLGEKFFLRREPHMAGELGRSILSKDRFFSIPKVGVVKPLEKIGVRIKVSRGEANINIVKRGDKLVLRVGMRDVFKGLPVG